MILRRTDTRWLLVLSLACLAASSMVHCESPRKSVIRLDIDGPTHWNHSAGGIVVEDLDGDGRGDFLVTARGQLAAYRNDGEKLWSRRLDILVGRKSETEGLPGHHGPGVAAADVDGDGRAEVLFLTRDGAIHCVDGVTGSEKGTARPAAPKGAARWELAMVADFRGGGDRDVLLQATNEKGYRTGRFLAAYAYGDLIAGKAPLWTFYDFASCAHNGARLADLDGDGRDEVLGEMILNSSGRVLAGAAKYRGHMDSVFVADVDPATPALEVVLLEEGSNHVQLLGTRGVLWRAHHRNQEPQNAAVGRFRADGDEVVIWCRSRYAEHQKPFIFDSKGRLIGEYAMDDVAPEGWTSKGVEVIHTIDWTGERRQLACAKERHERGDVGVFDPLTGRFVEHIPEQADRLYVYDVRGDWREEIIVLSGNEIRIYENTSPNPRPEEKRLWKSRNYRRLKQCHNYYSP